MSNTSIKALDLLSRSQHLKFFDSLIENNGFSVDNDKITKLFKILLILINKDKESSLLKYFYLDKFQVAFKVKELYEINKSDFKTAIINEYNNIEMTTEKAFWCYKIISDDIDNFTPAAINKINSTCGVFTFGIKEILEFYGVIVERKSSAKEVFKLNEFCEIRISKILSLADKLI